MQTFNVIGATLSEEFGGYASVFSPTEPISTPESETSLSLQVKLADNTRITLSTGEDLKNLKGFVVIYSRPENFEEDGKGVGVMSYSAERPDYSIPATYFIEVLLPPTQFADLLATVRLGRIPSEVTVDAKGMKLPNEFCEEWDIQSSPALNVASIELSIPLVGGETHSDNEEPLRAPFLPPTQLQILRLTHDIRMFGSVLQSMNAKLKVLLVLIPALIAVVLMLKR